MFTSPRKMPFSITKQVTVLNRWCVAEDVENRYRIDKYLPEQAKAVRTSNQVHL